MYSHEYKTTSDVVMASIILCTRLLEAFDSNQWPTTSNTFKHQLGKRYVSTPGSNAWSNFSTLPALWSTSTAAKTLSVVCRSFCCHQLATSAGLLLQIPQDSLVKIGTASDDQSLLDNATGLCLMYRCCCIAGQYACGSRENLQHSMCLY